MLLLTLLACSSSLDPAPYGACDPLDPEHCALPWPSSFYLTEAEDDAAWHSGDGTGLRLDLREGTLPTNIDGAPLDPWTWNEKDGFSTWGPLVFWFSDLDPASLPPWDDLAVSVSDASTVLLIDAETGDRVPLWAELDNHGGDPAVMVRLAEPMRHGARYVVGIRGLTTYDGAPAPASPAFESLRDGLPAESWDVEGRRGRYEAEIFPILEDAGVARGELQLAWDFTTVSEANSLGRPEAMRDDARATWGEAGPAYAISAVEDGDCADDGVTIGRTVSGELYAPRYTEADAPRALLTRGEDGLPYAVDEVAVPFLIRIPCAVTESPAPARVVQYGHGLLGSREEIEQEYMGQLQDDFGWIVAAVDWTGLSSEDRGPLALMMSEDPSGFATIPERTLQGFVEADALRVLLQGALVEDEALQIDGARLLDPDQISFYGISAGSILGTAYLGYSQAFDRGALSVPGAPFTTLLPRSTNFEPFELILETKYEDPHEISALMAAFQTLWDPGEAAGWARVLQVAPGDRRTVDVLIQTGTGDAQVSTLGAHSLARALGASTVAPQTREIWGVDEREPGFSGAAIVEWEYIDGAIQHGEPLPLDNDADTHFCVRREADAQEQLRIFLEEGRVEHTCDGPCEGVLEDFCDQAP